MNAAVQQFNAHRDRAHGFPRYAAGANVWQGNALFCQMIDTLLRYSDVLWVCQIGAIIFRAPLPILAVLPLPGNGNADGR